MRQNTKAEIQEFERLRLNSPATMIYATEINNKHNRLWYKFLAGSTRDHVFIVNSSHHQSFYYTTKRPHRKMEQLF